MPPLIRRHPRGRPPHPDVLTPAEWRVLDELREGRSNPEIADRLGLSRNTVKTHVSSILSKLDLRDRDEVAAWRGQPAPVAARRSPLFAAFGWLGAKEKVIAMAVASAIVGVSVVAVASGQLISSGSTSPTTAVAPTELPAVPTASPTPVLKPTLTPAQPLFPPLRVGQPIELPEDIALYVWAGCTTCESPPTELRRFTRSGNNIEEESLFERSTVITTVTTPTIVSGWIDEDVIYMTECSAGFCGFGYKPSANAAITLYQSVDDGVTWESLGERLVSDLGTARPTPADWDVGSTYPVASPTSMDETHIQDVAGVEVDLRALDPRGIMEHGNVPYYAPHVDVDDRGWILMQWSVTIPALQGVSYLSIFDSNGTPVATFESPRSSLTSLVWLDANRIIGTVRYDSQSTYQSPDIESGWIPSIIDVRDGSVRPILEPFGRDPANRNTVVGIQQR